MYLCVLQTNKIDNIMEIEKKGEPFFKFRSAAKCLSAGIHLLTDNLKTLVHFLWIPILIFSLLNGIAFLIIDRISLNVSLSDKLDILPIVIMMGLIIVLYLALLFICGCIYTYLKKYRELDYPPSLSIKSVFKDIKHNMWRYFKLMLIFFIISVVYVTITGYLAYLSMWTLFFTISLGIAAMIPFIYSIMVYMMEDNSSIMHAVKKSFHESRSHWGGIFLVVVITLLIVFIAEIILYTPFLLLQIIAAISKNSVEAGDPSGLPSYFIYLEFFTSAICTFIAYFVLLIEEFSLFFLYGSYEQQNREKAEIAQQEELLKVEQKREERKTL